MNDFGPMPYGLLRSPMFNPANQFDPQNMPQGLLAFQRPQSFPQPAPMPGASPAPAAQPDDGGDEEAPAKPPMGLLGGNVPLPPPRPADLGGSTPAPAMSLSGDTANASPPKPAEKGWLDSIGDHLANAYGNGGKFDPLINLGLGMASDPMNWAAGALHGSQLTSQQANMKSQSALNTAKAQQASATLQGGIATVKAAFPNLSDAQAASYASNPALLQMAANKLTPEGLKPQMLSPGAAVFGPDGKKLFENPAADKADKADKTQNYVIRDGSGNVATTGRTIDGKTDMTTGEPLPANAQMAGTSGPAVQVLPGERAEDAEVGKSKGQLLGGVISGGAAAHQKLQLLSQLDDAFKAGGSNIHTGPFSQGILEAKRGIGDLFGTQLDGVGPSDVASKLAFSLATNLTKEITNRPAQAEFIKALQNVPGLSLSPEGNQAMISLQKQDAQHKMDLAGVALGSKNYAEYQPKERAYYDAHPLLSPFTGKAFGSNDIDLLTRKGQIASGALPPDASVNYTPGKGFH